MWKYGEKKYSAEIFPRRYISTVSTDKIPQRRVGKNSSVTQLTLVVLKKRLLINSIPGQSGPTFYQLSTF